MQIVHLHSFIYFLVGSDKTQVDATAAGSFLQCECLGYQCLCKVSVGPFVVFVYILDKHFRTKNRFYHRIVSAESSPPSACICMGFG